MTQKQKSRHAFIRAAKKDYGLTQGQSNALYSKWSAKRGGLVSAADLKRHPIIAKRLSSEVRGIPGTSDKKSARSGGVSGVRAGEISKRSSAGGGGSTGSSRSSVRSVKTLQDWESYYDDYDYDPVEYESSADYGEV